MLLMLIVEEITPVVLSGGKYTSGRDYLSGGGGDCLRDGGWRWLGLLESRWWRLQCPWKRDYLISDGGEIL